MSSVHVHARGRGTKTCMSCGLRLCSGPSRTTSAPLALLCLRVRGSSATAAWGVDLRSCATRRLCLPRDASQHPEVSARPFPRRTGDAEAPLTVVEGWHLSRCRATPLAGSQADSGSRAWGPGGSPSHMAKADEVRPQPHGGEGVVSRGPWIGGVARRLSHRTRVGCPTTAAPPYARGGRAAHTGAVPRGGEAPVR